MHTCVDNSNIYWSAKKKINYQMLGFVDYLCIDIIIIIFDMIFLLFITAIGVFILHTIYRCNLNYILVKIYYANKTIIICS